MTSTNISGLPFYGAGRELFRQEIANMIHIRSLADTDALAGDPVLRREVYSYLSYCMSECDEEDDTEFEFAVLSKGDIPMLADLGQPEETVKIIVADGDAVRTITRLVYAAEVFFVPGEVTNHAKEA